MESAVNFRTTYRRQNIIVACNVMANQSIDETIGLGRNTFHLALC